ncbi:MAG TPA: ABC transporter substrate-binding protein [Chloroflexota bacterium]|nr:ABC transporter substrate-binding protein [Chloroflexota bacterium]
MGSTVGGSQPGVDAIEELLNVGMSTPDAHGVLQARLAEEVPTVENGHWIVTSDGRMETTWTIRPNAQWHDGVPVTADDMVFTVQVGQDREIPVFRDPTYDIVESVDALDARTVRVRWSGPYIRADSMFSRAIALPLPKHILADPYTYDRAGFLDLSYWSGEFIGTGAFRVKEFERGASLTVSANDAYVLGRPKIDEIEIRFIPDNAAVVANLLADSVEVTLGRSLSLEQGVNLRDQWRDGTVDIASQSWMALYPQLLTPHPAIIGEAAFRRALLDGIDRQEMADTLEFGMVPVAHVYVSPQDAEFNEILPSVVKYEYDPRSAKQRLSQLGFETGADGSYRDAAGTALGVQIQVTSSLEAQVKSAFSVADYWQKLGIGVGVDVVPPQRATDAEYRATFSGFALVRQPNDVDAITRAHSRTTPLPENNFTGLNRTRYRNPEFDAQIDSYTTTIPFADRMRVLGQIVHFMTDQVLWMGLFYETEPTAIAKRLKNVTARSQKSVQTWNAHDWDVSS